MAEHPNRCMVLSHTLQLSRNFTYNMLDFLHRSATVTLGWSYYALCGRVRRLNRIGEDLPSEILRTSQSLVGRVSRFRKALKLGSSRTG